MGITYLPLKLTGFGCPGIEEAEHLILAVATAFFQETGVLGMDDLTLGIKDDKDREPETNGIAQTLEHGRRLCTLF